MSKVDFRWAPPYRPSVRGCSLFFKVNYVQCIWALLFKPKKLQDVCRSENKFGEDRSTLYRELNFFQKILKHFFWKNRHSSDKIFTWNFFLTIHVKSPQSWGDCMCWKPEIWCAHVFGIVFDQKKKVSAISATFSRL